ncbi:MAG: anthranilate phosphoribosyltransferase [Gemmatimonadetes bacterium]|nr:anthranilate phosphoribosyltransferase [Gemmatimonadota bacterium]
MTNSQGNDTEPVVPPLPDLLRKLGRGETLAIDEAETAFAEVMHGRTTPVQVAALLMALRTRRETAAEVAGGVRALRGAMIRVPAERADQLVDTCGTGGGAFTTFNISTAAALVAAAAGVRVAKHGNRSFSSRSGSADVLEALGVAIELSPADMGEVLAECGIVFMFAPLLHPAMRHVGPVRRELGMPTIMNLLGPLTNPAGAERQVVGVADPRTLALVAEALRQLGHRRALVVHGEPGLDELSPLGPSRVFELRSGQLSEYLVSPADFGYGPLDPAELAGGDPAANAALIESILAGERTGAARAATAMNAGAAIYLAGVSEGLAAGIAAAETIIADGAAPVVLDHLRRATNARGRRG